MNRLPIHKRDDPAVSVESLLDLLKLFDEYTLDAVTETCVDYDDDALAEILFYFEKMKRKNFLFQWSVIATKAYKVRKKRKQNPKSTLPLDEELMKTFPMYKRAILLRKLAGWDTFYQDPQATNKAKWNGKSYLFEEVRHGTEAWFFFAMRRASSREEAISRIRMAEIKYLESLNDPQLNTYQPGDLLKDIRIDLGLTKATPPFNVFFGKLTSIYRELDRYLKFFNYSEDYEKSFVDLRNDLKCLANETGFLAGKTSEEDVISSLENSRIDESVVLDLNIGQLSSSGEES